MDDLAPFHWALLLLYGAGAGFIGSGFGVAIATHRKPSVRSGWNTTIISFIVGVALIAFAWYRAGR